MHLPVETKGELNRSLMLQLLLAPALSSACHKQQRGNGMWYVHLLQADGDMYSRWDDRVLEGRQSRQHADFAQSNQSIVQDKKQRPH